MTHVINRRTFLAGVGAAGIGLAGSVGSVHGQQGGQELRVGVLQPVTGDLASVGIPIRDAALLPAIQLNDAGTDYRIVTQAEDTQTDPQAGISAAQALVDAGYPSITGPAASEVTIQVAQNVLIPNQVVGCSPSSTAPEITGLQDDGFVWRTCPSDAVQGQVLAQVAANRVNASSVSIMFVNNSYGQALANSFAQSFDGEIPARVAFEQVQSSYAAQLQEALASQPDALLIISYPESGNQLFRDFYSSYSRDIQILVTDGLRDPELPGNVGQPLTNVIGTAPSAAGPAQQFFTQQYQREYGSAPGVFTAQAYDATAIQILANVAGGARNRGPPVRDNMQAVANPPGRAVGPNNLPDALALAANGTEINYQGASSSVTFDDNGDVTTAAYEIFTYTEGGGIEQLDVVEFQTDRGN
ncbi:ABC transporter substrate-binding protein [Halegenticoccus tardaugens]|uniref:ABC transporter substrate-binding protein n=1 Tax=Halegenticoccus tardaugens TaxID=2071624 RepID=UPI00100AC8A4|nr:ABC transporter substrate-binding protein [Halegenticoccus tardaugens]